MTRGTALVSLGQVIALTGRTTLQNLQSSGELSLDALLVTASDAVFDRLEVDGINPTTLTNESRAERVVAWHFLALIAAQGRLNGADETPQQVHDRFLGLSEKYYRDYFKPRVSDADASTRPGAPVPRVKNINCSHF